MNLVKIENCRATVKQYLYCKSELVMDYQCKVMRNTLRSARNTKKGSMKCLQKNKKSPIAVSL